MRKSWFETLFDPFPLSPVERPPDRLLAFYRYFIHPVRWLVLVVLLVSLAGTVIEMSLYVFLGKIVDWTSSTPREQYFAAHGWQLAGMVLVVLLARPAVALLQRGFNNLSLVPTLTAMVRWQNYRYVLRQSLSFFQNDFAGRIAQKVMQTGPSLRETVRQPDRRHLDAHHLCRRHGVAVQRPRSLADRAGRGVAGVLCAHHLEAGAAGARSARRPSPRQAPACRGASSTATPTSSRSSSSPAPSARTASCWKASAPISRPSSVSPAPWPA